MRRFRIAFALVAAAVLGAVGLLVLGALESVDVERRARHEVVAERVFDEMERALSSFVTAEEARPFGPRRELAGAAPFVVAAFDVGPDGRVGVSSSRSAPGELEEALDAALRGSPPAGAKELTSQSPGSTVPLDAKSGEAREPAREDDEAAASVYQALRSLNKGVEQRAERRTKLFRPERVALSPLTGRRIDAGRLVLVRTAASPDGDARQGLVIDVAALGRWLGAEALGSTELASRAALDFGDGPASRGDGGLVYRHRFAEPFESLTARLALTPLPGLGEGRSVLGLAALSLAAVALGLAALYRMTAVVLGYAERRSNFVAAVTHELKTPLTAIRLYAEMLRDGIVPSEAKRDEYYRHITSESARLTRLVDNVLEFSRLENGVRSVALETGDVGAVVGELATLVRLRVEGAGFTLDVAVDAALPRVRFERDALEQVLFNLVDNAVKYADGAAPRSIELRCRAADGGVRLSVRDHGPGVPSRHLARIFEPFYRAEDELTRRTKGTGLGLALVRGLAERMGARVRGRNAAGGGFEVEVDLPPAR